MMVLSSYILQIIIEHIYNIELSFYEDFALH